MVRWPLRVLLLAAVLLVGGLALLFLPPVADHFGYARPVPHGLPTRFSLGGIPFRQNFGCFGSVKNGRCTWALGLAAGWPPCPTRQFLRKRGVWPLLDIGTIPTLLGFAHRVYEVEGPFAINPAYNLVLVQDGRCYDPYQRTGWSDSTPFHPGR